MKTHTADEATLDGETPSQDSVYVSDVKLKIELNSTDFVIAYSKSFYLHPIHLLPTRFPSRLAMATPRIGQER